MRTTWQSYEQVAQFLLDQFATHFGLGRVQGKQLVPGASGTNWEIDAKAVKADSGGFLIVECRRHTTAGVSQEDVGGLCYRIQDTGASGGIIVSPLVYSVEQRTRRCDQRTFCAPFRGRKRTWSSA
jgi:hypothetical protein